MPTRRAIAVMAIRMVKVRLLLGLAGLCALAVFSMLNVSLEVSLVDSRTSDNMSSDSRTNNISFDSTRQINYSSNETKPHKLAILIPFRNCHKELEQFVPHMAKFLEDQHVHYTIYIINQDDDYRFNRATLVNIGFLESSPDCDYIAIHDVDLLPLNNNLSYQYPGAGPYHVASPHLHPYYFYDDFVGGILLITKEHFRALNGMSNKFWGWGGEDDEFKLRINKVGLKLHRPPSDLKTGRTTFRDTHTDRVRDQAWLFNERGLKNHADMSTGLNNTHYKVKSREVTLRSNAVVIFINVQLTCAIRRTPWCLQKKDHNLLKEMNITVNT